MIVDFDVTDDRVRRARPRWFLAALAGVAIGALVASLLPEPAPPLKADALVRQSVANLSQARSYHKRGVATYPDVQGMARFYEISVDIDGPYNNRVVWNSADPANAVESLSVDGHRYEHRPEGWSESSFPAAISTHPHEPLGDRWTFVDGPTLHEVDQAVIDGRLTRHLAYSANVGDIAYSVFEAIGIPPRGVGTIVTSPATIELWIGAVDAQITRVRYTLALGSRVYYFEETYSHLGEAPVPAIVAPTAVQVDAGAGAPLGPLDAYLSGTAAGDRARALRAWTVLSGMPAEHQERRLSFTLGLATQRVGMPYEITASRYYGPGWVPVIGPNDALFAYFEVTAVDVSGRTRHLAFAVSSGLDFPPLRTADVPRGWFLIDVWLQDECGWLGC